MSVDDPVNDDHQGERRNSMRYVLMIEAQQGLSYDEQLAIARRAERAGFEGFFRSDHYESFPGSAGDPTTDAWAVLAGLARETSTIRLAPLVSPVTYRLPGNLAKLGATVAQMANGRLEVGVGAGWHEDEHRRHGFPFPPIEQRAEMLEETLEILHGLWEGPDGWTFEGRHYRVEDAIFSARPDPRPRIIVGGTGSPRSIRIAARYADEFNLTSTSPDKARAKYQELADACTAIGRDPATMTRSAMVGVLVGADAEDLRRRETALLQAIGAEEAGDDWFTERRTRWILGTPDEARAAVARFADAGVERIMLQDFLPRDLDMVDLIGAELVARG
jgi:F420-dependent oxidoreductase-like protein